MSIFILGSARASRAGDRALAIANFFGYAILLACLPSGRFGEGAEMCTRGRVRSPEEPQH